MILETFPVGMLQCNCTILGDETTGEAMVIDPGDNIPQIVARLEKHRLKLKQIVVTHAHIDHVGGALKLKQQTGAPIFLNQNDLPLLEMMEMQAGWLGTATPEVAPPDASADDHLVVGLERYPATVLHTPGHTPGSICLHFAPLNLLVAGDTLFAGSIGRTDLPGGDYGKILRSIRDRLLPLPDETQVIPGHGPATTIGEERDSNPFLQG
ncbi:MBL fold metallo-hydrolase [Alloacidobacterium dinghuense]|uniref:MBL fold metallo-hydrolase n=1 Tax=Alloacidobacterium dinghuense TaxID=2763107 RepID=A0A7G8BPM0_9BACT|nr:MBL fold metallo-hydrolase [Alloacidobacterium dinghuense]QNI34490.1 MBL fold metallo-hydrolase [Alloacidobacterium dinghuense]